MSDYEGQRVLVTGGAGFIGSHLVERLSAEGASITVVDDLSTGRLVNLVDVAKSYTFIQGGLGDLLTSQVVQPIGFDCIFHLAGNSYIPWSIEDPVRDYVSNLESTFLLLEAMRATSNPPRLVNVSSAAVYGKSSIFPIFESDPTLPISPYGVSKLAAEHYTRIYYSFYGLRTASLRLFSVYGPRQRKQVIYDLMDKLRQDSSSLHVLGDGTQVRDFIHVYDVVEAALLVGRVGPCHGEVYNVATGTSHTIAEMVSILCEVSEQEPEIAYSGKVRLGDTQKWEVDIGWLCRLGFHPSVNLRAGLRNVVEWYDDQGV